MDKLRIDEGKHGVHAASMRLLLAGAVCFAVGVCAGYLLKGWSRPGPSLRVKTAVVKGGGEERARSFSAGGWIEAAAPQYPLLVSAQVEQRLQTLLVRQGDFVEPGGVIATLFDETIRTRLALAEARSAEQAEKLRIADAVYRRSSSLAAGTISAEDLDRDLAGLNMAKASAAAAEAEADLMRKELSYCTVKAPESSRRLRVLDVFHGPGSWIGRNAEAAIVSLYDPSNLQVRVDVAQPNIRFARPGGPVEVRTEANSQKAYSGTVLRIEPQAELAKNTVTVRIAIVDPDDMLFPDMVAHVNFLADLGQEGADRSRLIVPSAAVFSEGESSFAFVCDKNTAVKRKIEVDRVQGQVALVKSGLSSGQRVIISDLDKLADGAKVEAD